MPKHGNGYNIISKFRPACASAQSEVDMSVLIKKKLVGNPYIHLLYLVRV